MGSNVKINTKGLSQEEIDLFSQIQDAVDIRVHDRVEKELKLLQGINGPHKINEAAIEEECTREIFKEMAIPMAIALENIIQFTNLLKIEDEKTYNELTGQVTKEELEKELPKEDASFKDLIEFSKKHTTSPELLDKIYTMGLNHYKAGEHEKAFLYYNWLCTADANNPQVWFLKGLTEEARDKFQEAIVAYYMVLSLDPTMLHVYPQLISCCILSEDFATARALYNVFTTEINVNDMKDDPLLQDNMERIKERLEKSNL